jgi:hypothetical protein
LLLWLFPEGWIESLLVPSLSPSSQVSSIYRKNKRCITNNTCIDNGKSQLTLYS